MTTRTAAPQTQTKSRIRGFFAWLADREIIPTLLGVALATFSPRWAPWGLGLLATTWIVRWIARGHLSLPTPLDGPVVLLLLTVPVTCWVTVDPPLTAIAVSRLLAGLALAYGLVNWARDETRRSLLALGLAALALFATVSVTWPGGKLPFIPPALYDRTSIRVDDTVNANMMAGALVVALPVPVALLLLAPPGRLPSVAGAVPPVLAWLLDYPVARRAWFAFAALSAAAVLILTKSRGAWLAAAVALALLLVARWRPLAWLLPLLPLGLALLAWRLGPAALLDAFSRDGALSGWESRVEIWSRASYAIQDFPYTGVGANAFARATGALYPYFLSGPDADISHAHNLLLQVAVDLGIPGLVAYLAIVILALWAAHRAVRRHLRAGQRALAALAWAGAVSLVAMLVHGLVDATTWIVGRGAFVPWAIIGTIVALGPAKDAFTQ
jgi:putative inorganic carbon (HCO3(-)) transporter